MDHAPFDGKQTSADKRSVKHNLFLADVCSLWALFLLVSINVSTTWCCFWAVAHL